MNEVIKQLRIHKGLTQRELAKYLAYSNQQFVELKKIVQKLVEIKF